MTRQTTHKNAHLHSEPDMQSLWQMLQTMRPASSKAEEDFIRDFIAPLGTEEDGFGNLILRIGNAPIMFTSHTDTVHRKSGTQRIVQKAGLVKLSEAEKDASCLGADCTAGVWLMREMILNQVSGLYVFFREEESGGIGSQWFADNTPEVVDGIQVCLSLDRKGTDSIITHQAGGRCASDAFARSLAKQMRGYKADDGGLFTDSANLTHLVPECSNLSVGYENAHTTKETLAYLHLLDVRDMLLRLDHRKLAIQRQPEPKQARRYYGAYSASSWYGEEDWADDSSYGSASGSGYWQKQTNHRARSVYEFVMSYPEETADLLEQYGITVEELLDSAPWLK